MHWDLETRRKLARAIMDLSLRVQLEQLKQARNYREALDATDRRIMGMLAPMGFTKANSDWIPEARDDLTIFHQSEDHLWFETVQARVLKIRKKDALNLLVLGFP